MEARKFGRYEILAELGKGAMGVVYKANDPLLNRTVAIKTVNMSLDPQERAKYEARFHLEAKAAGGLNHPNIVTVYDIGKSGNVAYMAMEFLEGKELRVLMSPGKPLPVARAVEIAAQVADGLAHAHQNGVVHRDVKPANIMIVRDDLAKITDFGIARMRTAEVKTQAGVVLGSPRYMSPEQVAGKRADPRSDIFSLGVILYEMLTGKPPFTGQDVTSIMFQILNVVPPPPSSLNRQVPEMLDFIAAKALTKPPDDRYQDAKNLVQDLREAGKRLESADQPPATKTRPPLQPKLNTEAAEALAHSLPGTRSADAEQSTLETAPALGLSKAFDSLSATMRLAAQSGMASELKESPGAQQPVDAGANQAALASSPRLGTIREQPGWTRSDKTIFLAAVAAATLIGAAILLI